MAPASKSLELPFMKVIVYGKLGGSYHKGPSRHRMCLVRVVIRVVKNVGFNIKIVKCQEKRDLT